MSIRDEIKKKLIEVYSVLSNFPPESISESTHLANDLLLFAALRKGLADTYTRLSTSYGGGIVTIPEAAKVKTVIDAIKLILSKIPSASPKTKAKSASPARAKAKSATKN